MNQNPADDIPTIQVSALQMAIALAKRISAHPYSPIAGALIAGCGLVLPLVAQAAGWLLLSGGAIVFVVGAIGKLWRLMR